MQQFIYSSSYYWTAFQCEWATDVMFRPDTLARLSPLFLQHAMLGLSSPDVMRFLGRRVNVTGQIPAHFGGELTMDFKSRVTGDRVKYRMEGNSLKGYGKASTPIADLFRVETTTQNVECFKVYRPVAGGAEDELKWQRMRRGVADLFRRAEVSQKSMSVSMMRLPPLTTAPDSANSPERWSALASTKDGVSARYISFGRMTISYCKPSIVEISCSRGLRNRDLQTLLYPPVPAGAPLSVPERRRRSAAISRKLRLLRAHGLIQKVPKTHRYQVTPHGKLAITAILTMDRASVAVLSQLQKAA